MMLATYVGVSVVDTATYYVWIGAGFLLLVRTRTHDQATSSP
jgi:hypothetical protein